jgi:glyceraldehyde 3-phosphate dehydrogenase
MSINVGINGFGRMGKLTARCLLEQPNFNLIKINDPNATAQSIAHLLNFDSVHGTWQQQAHAVNDQVKVNESLLACFANTQIEETDWSDCDLVIEASGVMRSSQQCQAYRQQSVKKVLVTAPVYEPEVPNIVFGVNQAIYNAEQDWLITAASCTTNCIAPAIKVIHEQFGISHGSMTSIHSITNTQTILDSSHKDLRRARACGMSLIPTTTGSAIAIADIFPELKGRLNGHAVRVPLANASLTDCVFELKQAVTVSEVNQALLQASENELRGILGYEERPLVSIDYRTDPRSTIVDALSTMVVNGTQLKLYLWYDNEWGYVNRVIDLANFIGEQL